MEEENKNSLEFIQQKMGGFSEEAMKMVKASLKKYEALHIDTQVLESNQSIEEFFKENMERMERENKKLIYEIDQGKKLENVRIILYYSLLN